jgi:hypothetical protein
MTRPVEKRNRCSGSVGGQAGAAVLCTKV